MEHDIIARLVADVPVIFFLLAANSLVWRRLVRLEEALITHLEASHHDNQDTGSGMGNT